MIDVPDASRDEAKATPDPYLAAPDSAPDRPLAPGLYLVATPIGNLEDITLRALRVLRSVDRIACEDTRQTQKLLNHYGIRKPTVSYHLHNEAHRAAEWIAELQAGARLAVVSDAGTPGIADPGATLVRAAIVAGVSVYPIPGANACINGLIASGLETERFTFHGFLPARAGERRSALEALRARLTDAPEAATQVFYETPHRILDALQDVVATFGPQHGIALARELTKLHEEFLRGSVEEVLATLSARPAVRGEMVLLLDGSLEKGRTEPSGKQSLTEDVSDLMRSGLSEKDALKQAAKARGLGKSEAYREWQRHKR